MPFSVEQNKNKYALQGQRCLRPRTHYKLYTLKIELDIHLISETETKKTVLEECNRK